MSTDNKNEEQVLQDKNQKRFQIMVSITRHDIINQLHVAMGYTALAKDLCQDTQEQYKYFKGIEVAHEKIQRYILFTHEYENIGKEPKWQSISEIIQSISYDEVIIRDECSGLSVFADSLLEKVFSNLIDNTVRHGGKNVTEARISYCAFEDGINIIYEDDGVGIPSDQKKKIFEKGYGKNTGLGLFLVRQILSTTRISIRETGGTNGARFEIFVPKGEYLIKEDE